MPPGPGSGNATLDPGTRLVVVGNTFAERLAQSGVFDAVVHAAHPEHRLVIRHIPWSGDEVALRPREMNVPTMLQWIDRLDADVVMLCFGMSESFTQTAEQYETQLRELHVVNAWALAHREIIGRACSGRWIDPAGEKFDPNLHEAMTEIDDPDAAPGTVVQVFQTGYVINDRLLRPARVIIAKRNGKNQGQTVDTLA